MKRFGLAMLLVGALVVSGCGAKGGSSAATDDGVTSTTAARTETPQKFGTLDSPCGPAPAGKKVTIKAEDAGTGTDKLYIGVANDRTAEAQPGLDKELWDAGSAFVAWCNSQGGVAGIPLAAVDLDGQLIKVEAAMTRACHETFALVAGGFGLDSNVFTGKPDSDFHECKLIAIPGFAVSTEFAEANGVVQPIPNPAYTKSAVFLHDIAQAYPKQVRKTVAVYGEGIPSIARNKDQVKATAAKAVPEMKFLPDITHALLGQDFSVIAQKIIDSGATAVAYVGEPISFSSLLFELKAKGWDGIAFADANDYDQKLFVKGNDAVDGTLLRLAQHMYEEADDYPVVKQLRDTIESFGPPNPTIAALSVQSFSAGLLFAQAVKNCVETGSGEISRVCVLDAAKKIDSWDGGGLHAAASPGKNLPPSCSMIVVANRGKFERFEPKSKTNDGGFHCDEKLTVKIEGDLGKGNVDPTLPY